jgi:hypothetical protein
MVHGNSNLEVGDESEDFRRVPVFSMRMVRNSIVGMRFLAFSLSEKPELFEGG